MKNDLVIRGISGLLFLVIMIGTMMLDKRLFVFLFFILTIFGLKEFIQILKAKKQSVDGTFIILTSIGVYLLLAGLSFYSPDHHIIEKLTPIFIVYPIYAIVNLFTKKVNDPGIHSPVLTSVLLIAVPFGLLNFLFIRQEISIQPILAFFILLWTNDTFAYLVGKFLGRNKLMSSVSPKKTWEGFIGGILFSLLAGLLLKDYVPFLENNNWIYFALIVSVFGTLGDLYESRLKRWADVKDSGQIMPGHGGVLDRFDGVMLSIPVILFLVYSL